MGSVFNTRSSFIKKFRFFPLIFGFTLDTYIFAAFMPFIWIFSFVSAILGTASFAFGIEIFISPCIKISYAILFTYLVFACGFFNEMRWTSRARWMRINELRFCEGFSISFARVDLCLLFLVFDKVDAWHKEIELKLVYNSKYKSNDFAFNLPVLLELDCWLAWVKRIAFMEKKKLTNQPYLRKDNLFCMVCCVLRTDWIK